MSNNITLCVLLAVLGGCRAATIVEEVLTEDRLDVTYPLVAPEQNVISGSIFDNGAKLYPAGRSYSTGNHKVGDIVTIILQETAQASRSSALSTERETENGFIGANQAAGLFPGGQFFNGIDTDGGVISSNGTGSAGQSASLYGFISASVVEVMPNGNLIVVGEKRLALNEGSEVISVRGVVRPDDIQPNNTVLSRRLAAAEFSYSGNGELRRATRTSWGSKLLFDIWPF
ncbi:MAG: flagellar basal body L-ring protein FlgH [Gammaproteobacteria bacterium]|jgi:flagellar L-ring protein precursor FlgH